VFPVRYGLCSYIPKDGVLQLIRVSIFSKQLTDVTV
jgi:hypothetical protein